MGKKYFRIVDWMLSIILVIIMLFISSSVFVRCALGRGTEPISIPYGVWHSEAPNMTLYINPAQDEIDPHYPGEVYWDGDIIKVVP